MSFFFFFVTICVGPELVLLSWLMKMGIISKSTISFRSSLIYESIDLHLKFVCLTSSFGYVALDFVILSCLEQGDPLYVKVNKLSSTKTQLPYDYYYLNYCKPPKILNNAENLGEVLRGDRIENSVYTVSNTPILLLTLTSSP